MKYRFMNQYNNTNYILLIHFIEVGFIWNSQIYGLKMLY